MALPLAAAPWLLAGSAHAEPPPAPTVSPEIVVKATLRGSVAAVVPQAPIATFDEADIASYGVSSINDLLDALSPETNSGRGRGGGSVILVNGVRIGSFREVRDYPPEAIRRVEILPEEVSLRYGFPPDQRVVNIILKDHVDAKTLEVEATRPQQGGAATDKFSGKLLKIDFGKRLNIAVAGNHTSPLSEAARGVEQASGRVPMVAGDPNPALYRTLVADSNARSLNATWTLPVGKGANSGTLAINLTGTHEDSASLNGLSTLDAGGTERTLLPGLATLRRTETLQSGAALNKPVGAWQLSATVDGTHAVTTSFIDQPAGALAISAALASGEPLGPLNITRTMATSSSATSLVTLIGQPVDLPGGKIGVTAKAGFAWSDQTSASDAPDTGGNGTVRRGDASLGVNIAVPVTSTRTGFGAKAGDITINLSAGANCLSDAGWLSNWSAGVTWGVTVRLNLQASFIEAQAAPALSSLDAPVASTSNVRVYDFATGLTDLATVTSGGNRALPSEAEHDIKLAANWSLPFSGALLGNSNLIVEYFNNRSSHVASGFPLLTPAVEAAFPGRVTRTHGVIFAIDERPISLASQHEARLRWGVNLFGNLGQPMPPARGGRLMGMLGGGGGGGPPPPGGGGRGGRGFGGGGRGARQGYPGRWNVSIYHTIQFIDRVVLAPGVAPLNLLGGDALGSGGGVARHAVELDAGSFYKGFGLRFSGTWTGPTHVDPLGAPLASDLRFGAVASFRARLFTNFGQQARLVAAVPFLKGARMSVLVNNLFDAHARVTNGLGQTPVAYQPALLDPLGRVFGLEFRKLF